MLNLSSRGSRSVQRESRSIGQRREVSSNDEIFSPHWTFEFDFDVARFRSMLYKRTQFFSTTQNLVRQFKSESDRQQKRKAYSGRKV